MSWVQCRLIFYQLGFGPDKFCLGVVEEEEEEEGGGGRGGDGRRRDNDC